MATRWACVGPGKISHDFFTAIRTCLAHKDHEFVAVASRDITKAEKFLEEHKFKKAYGSYDELAQDKDVEVVYIGTLHITHVELSIKMLNAGKHVICEKPMAINLKDAKRVFDAAEKNQKLFIDAIWSRFLPTYTQIRKELEQGTLGEVRLVQAEFSIPIYENERIKSGKLGGGGLLDVGIYVIQLACWVYKEMPESITAVGTLSENGEVDIGASIILKYKSGAMASLTYNVNAGLGPRTAYIMGTKGRIDVEAPFWCPEKIVTPSGTFEYPFKEANYFHVNASGLAFEAEATRQAILTGKRECDVCTRSDSEMIMAIMDEVRRQIGLKYPDFD